MARFYDLPSLNVKSRSFDQDLFLKPFTNERGVWYDIVSLKPLYVQHMLQLFLKHTWMEKLIGVGNK